MPNYRRAIQPGGTFFFTLVTDGRAPIFADAHARRLLGQAMELERTARPFEIDAIVLLPDHLHLIMTLPQGDGNFSTRLGGIKSRFTRMHLVAIGDEQTGSIRGRRHGYRGVWQPRFWEHLIRDERDLYAHFDYIHYNPVKHGWAACPHVWKQSSFDRHVRLGHYDADRQCTCGGRMPKPPDFNAFLMGRDSYRRMGYE